MRRRLHVSMRSQSHLGPFSFKHPWHPLRHQDLSQRSLQTVPELLLLCVVPFALVYLFALVFVLALIFTTLVRIVG